MYAAHVLIPLKQRNGKSRLADVLSPADRASLIRSMFTVVVRAAREADVGPVTVVSGPNLEVDGLPVFDDTGLAWNDALASAMREVVSEPIATVVSADLPRVTADDIRALVAATPDRGMAIARALDGGTNAVSMRPAGAVMT